jgi:hypothetical protein
MEVVILNFFHPAERLTGLARLGGGRCGRALPPASLILQRERPVGSLPEPRP